MENNIEQKLRSMFPCLILEELYKNKKLITFIEAEIAEAERRGYANGFKDGKEVGEGKVIMS